MTRFEIIKPPPPGIVNVLFDLCVVYREGLTTSFTKIMTDEAVSTWRFDIHECIRKNSEKLLELICTKLQVTGFTIIFFFIYFLAGWIKSYWTVYGSILGFSGLIRKFKKSFLKNCIRPIIIICLQKIKYYVRILAFKFGDNPTLYGTV